MKELKLQDKKVYIELNISMEELKDLFLKNQTAFKKFINVFLNNYFNETFTILILTAFAALQKAALEHLFPGLETTYETRIRNGNEVVLKFFIKDFYGDDLQSESYEELYKKIESLSELEKATLENLVEKLKNDDFLERMRNFVKLTFSIDDLIKNYKININAQKRSLNFEVINYLFSGFAVFVEKNSFKGNKDFIEE